MIRTLYRVLVLPLSLVLAASGSAARADTTLYRNAAVFTARTDHADATWFVVRDGWIADVGDGAVPERWSTARAIDLGGRFVAPGFVDAHIHLVDGGLGLLQTDVSAVASEAELRAAIEKAAARPIGDWVVVRNLGVEVLGGAMPAHARMKELVAAAGDRPVLVLLKGGHHVYASPLALAKLGIGGGTADPANGQIVRDESGAPTGLLVDDAAWQAMRALAEDLTPEELAQAIVLADRQALRYGITSIGDNTFDPMRMAQYVRMGRAGVFHLRVAARSFGIEPATHFTMKSQGAGLFGRKGARVRFFGDKYFLDGALSNAGASAGAAPRASGPRYSVPALRELLLFAGPFGTAFHTQSREGAERLVAARSTIGGRRGELPDIIDHCGRCGGDGLPARIRAAGFRVTLLPGQLHELPGLLASEAATERAHLLAIRELFAAGLEPALTSDWPYGAEVNYPDVPEGLDRIGLAPLASVAVAVSGRTPAGAAIAGAESRTITIGQALLGVTRYGARAIGRDDVGELAPGKRADFVVLARDPFALDPTRLYLLDPDETYMDGRRVWGAADRVAGPQDVSRFASAPRGSAIAPIIGYDPIPGMLVGGAWFFYPYRARGLRGSVQLYGAPAQLTARAELELIAMRWFGQTSPRLWLRADTLRDRYYGVGMETEPGSYDETRPVRLDAQLGASHPLARTVEVGAYATFSYVHEGAADRVAARTGNAEGVIEGAAAGARVELAHDTRDNTFSTRFGGRRSLWIDGYGIQGGATSFRMRAGGSLSQFVPLLAPDLILGVRAEVGTSVGDVAYATDFALGGGDLLRGYYSNRFRGQHYAAGGAELRFPLVLALSGVVFGDLGRVWARGVESVKLAETVGFGLRYGLPPDRQVKLRFDVGFGRDQWGLFFKFNEAF